MFQVLRTKAEQALQALKGHPDQDAIIGEFAARIETPARLGAPLHIETQRHPLAHQPGGVGAPGPAVVLPVDIVEIALFQLAARADDQRSEEHTSELQSLMRISYAVFCLKKKTQQNKTQNRN